MNAWRPLPHGTWHSLDIAMHGTGREFRLNGETFFKGNTAISGGADLAITPGWGIGTSGIPHIDIADIEFLK